MYDKKMWNDKRYHSLDYYLKNTYGTKMYKLALNAGMTCPNRDGKLGTTGCIFCSQGGSGEFAASRYLSIPEQIEEAKLLINTKVRRSIKVGDDSYNVTDDGLTPEDAKLKKVKLNVFSLHGKMQILISLVYQKNNMRILQLLYHL